jgi:sialate O-acetylesterase
MLKLARLISDGAVLRREHPVRIWGWDVPGSRVRASLFRASGEMAGTAAALADETGAFSMELPGQPAGGPWKITVRNDAGEVREADGILFGTVWLVSGQSNIDVNMERCFDSYRQIVRDCQDPNLRTFRIETNADYHGPAKDLVSGWWEAADRNSILSFSATGYFFARALKELEAGIPVGFIQASLGGSRITCWMSRQMLEGNPAYQGLLEEADRYADDTCLQEAVRRNETLPEAWRQDLRREDSGCQNGWEREFPEGSDRMALPCLFSDTPLAGFLGSVWFSREFSVPEEMAGKSAGLWLGTMTDADETYVNGVKVGETGYQYPPRKYEVPEGVLRRGKNRITIRLVVESGQGRFTPGKGYFLFNDQGVVDLRGDWEVRIGKRAESPIPATDFVNWKATGLFNGMVAPCVKYPIDGIVWYQGEANTHEPYDYFDLSKRYIEGYRALWGENLPYLFVQLPNFSIDLDNKIQWPDLREKQRRLLSIPNTAMAAAMDLGEDNDLHPHGKREIGRRLALAADHLVFAGTREYTGPVPERAELVTQGEDGCRIRLTLSHAEGLFADSCDKGEKILDFALSDPEGRIWPAEARIVGNDILIFCDALRERPVQLLYAFSNVMHGASIYNGARLPMAPFVLQVEEAGQ